MIETGKIYPVPDSVFLRRLYEFDSSLQLNFDPVHGVWAIWSKHPWTGELSHVMNVVDPDGSYRPLDSRVFLQLRANRYFAEHPDELEKLLVDDIVSEREKQQKNVHDDMKHLSQDKSLKKEFETIRDAAGSVPWKEWQKPRKMHDEEGTVVHNATGEAVMYKPHPSLLENGGKKPTNLEEL